ncbi:diguanylate cyclase domain-containing protein [uncultured Nostoc sp.]|uniref:diguanylate cyclase domain-containing protein n=1 Tax=uncultured Nostoc sp. TaxID=340711 RepID=UPI0035CAC5DB
MPVYENVIWSQAGSSDRTVELAQTNVQLQQEITKLEQAGFALQFANQELQHLTIVDGLTQIANRRCFDQRLQQEWQCLVRDEIDIQ